MQNLNLDQSRLTVYRSMRELQEFIDTLCNVLLEKEQVIRDLQIKLSQFQHVPSDASNNPQPSNVQ